MIPNLLSLQESVSEANSDAEEDDGKLKDKGSEPLPGAGTEPVAKPQKQASSSTLYIRFLTFIDGFQPLSII